MPGARSHLRTRPDLAPNGGEAGLNLREPHGEESVPEARIGQYRIEWIDPRLGVNPSPVPVVEAEVEDALVEVERGANRVEGLRRRGVEDVLQRFAGTHHGGAELPSAVS